MLVSNPRIRALLFLICATALTAQEGHPLVGSWHGTWGPGTTERRDLTVIMMWDGKAITGLVNPGVDGGKIQNASLDPNGWKIHFESDLKSGHVVADGKIENVTNMRRTISGTWTQGATKGDFKITRDN
jgi:hypothetical protein